MKIAVEHVTDLEGDLANDESPNPCWLCDRKDRNVYWGLATLGIEYPGPTRFICDDCIEKVKRA